MAAKLATLFVGITDLQQRHHPQSIPHIVEKIKHPLKAKSSRF